MTINQEKPAPAGDRESDLDGTEPLPEMPDETAGHSSTFVLGGGVDDVAGGDATEHLQAGSILRDRYLLQERIGAGSMGVVFKALDRHLADAGGNDATVAIKVLGPELSGNPQALRALQQEAAKGRCLMHPGIVRFIDLDREDDFYFIVMEWLDGQSLAHLLDDRLLVDDLPRALDITRQVAEALEYAHKRGVVHADVKPGNVMLLPDGTTRLIDFGIARVQQLEHSAEQAPSVLKAASRMYSSMQVLTGETPVIADDVFSLACLAYRMIAGHRVFGPRNAAEAAELGLEPQRPGILDDNQWQALRTGLSHSRVVRQQSPAELVAGLTVAVNDTHAANAVSADGEMPLVIPAEELAGHRQEQPARRWPAYTLLFLVLVAVAAYVTVPEVLQKGVTQVRNVVAGFATPQQESSTPSAAVGRGLIVTPDAADSIAGESAANNSRDTTAAPAATIQAIDRSGAEADVPVGDVPDAADDPAGQVGQIGDDGLLRIDLAYAGSPVSRVDATVNENGEALSVLLHRTGGLAEPLLVRIDEVGFSGRRSPGGAGEYVLSGDGVISFDAGQAQAELVINARDDNVREADRTVSLSLRDYYNAESVLGQLELRLLDDDQRAFEANLPVNSVAFVRRELIVNERDPAAQIDIVRLNPDDGTLTVRYVAQDLNATEGEDYFVPTQRLIAFGPGQRNARLLISLVQDTVPEGDEHFIVELDPAMTHATTSGRVSVTIRDDDAIAE